MGDAADSDDFEHLDGFLEKLREGYDVVMGNRFKGGIEKGAMPWKNRYIGNPILSTIGKVLFHAQVGDFHCGLRGFRRDAFLLMDMRTTGMEFASEMVIKAKLLGLKMTEVPTTLRRDGRSRPPHLLPYRDGWRHLRFMLLFSPGWLFLYPGLATMVLGAVVGGMILARPIHLNQVQLGLDTLIYCSTILVVGFQAVLFWLLSRTYALQEGLYPETAAGHEFARHITLERGLGAGATMLLAGLAAAFYAVWQWKEHAFGMLDIEQIARIAIPSSIAISLGMEVVLFSLLLSTFGLNARPYTAMVEEIELNCMREEALASQ
jgi:hypothetical protein